MNIIRCFICVSLLLLAVTGAYGLTLTFDDVPIGLYGVREYYEIGVSFDLVFQAADHTNSTWGPPHSGNNVLIWKYPGGWTPNTIGLVKNHHLYSAYSVGGYFSTEPGTVLQMVGYYESWCDPPIALATIGSTDGAWNNVYVEISSPELIGEIEFKPVTTGALEHFCMDDMTINFAPEPSSLLAISFGLVPMGLALARKRHSRH